MPEQNKEGLEVLRFLYRYRKLLIAVSLSAAILALVVSFFIPSKYEAVATVFPPAFNSADRMLENPQFGYNIEADRLIQLGQSAILKDSVIAFFDLEKYYKIDRANKEWQSILLKKYNNDVSFERTKFMSVEIKVRNKDPEMAASMVNKMIDFLSSIWEQMFKSKMRESLDYAEKQYFQKQSVVTSLLDSIQAIRVQNLDVSLDKLSGQLKSKQKEVEKNLKELSELRESGNFYDYSSQVDGFSEELLKGHRQLELEKAKMMALENVKEKNDSAYVLAKGRYEGSLENEKYLRKQLDDLTRKGKDYDLLSDNLKASMDHYQNLRKQYEDKLYAFEPYVQSVELDYLETKYASERQAMYDLKRKYELAYRYYHQALPSLFIIDYARPDYVRKSPSFILNFILAGVLAFVLTTLFLLFRERLKELGQKVSEK